jgi:hypothetical protein
MCSVCSHKGELFECSAFPDGIPVEILEGKFDHRKPHEGDHGIMFNPSRKYGPPLVKEVLAIYE